MSKVKILYVIDYYQSPNAGTENQLFKLVSNLDRDKYEPHLLVFEDSPYLQSQSFPCDYSVLGSRSIKSPTTWLKLAKAAFSFTRRGFKLAHIFFNDPSVICPPVFSLFGIKSIISRRDMGYWYTPQYLKLLRKTKCFVNAVTVNSDAVKQITAKSENISLDKIHVIYNGYDLSLTQDVAVASQSNEISVLKQQGKLVIVLVANVRPIKRIDDMVHAMATLVEQQSNVHFVQIGGGDATELQKLAKEKGVAEHCHFLGNKKNVSEYLAFADIGVLCSESEGFSNAIVEYQLAALPAVCSRVGGNPEAISHGETGFLYDCADITSLSTYLLELVQSEAKIAEMGKRAQIDAKTKYDIKQVVQENAALYRTLLESQ